MKLLGMELGPSGGFAIGVGAVVLAPVVIALAGRAVRPLAKTGYKAGLRISGYGRDATRSIRSGWSGLVSEARAELAQNP